MKEDVQEWTSEYLTTDEYVIWKGKPVKGHLFSLQDIFLIPFSLIWGGFAIFWELMVIVADAPLFFRLWGLPFVVIGLYMIAGRFFLQAHIRKYTRYAVTNKRILRIRKRQMDSLNYHLCPQRRIRQNKDGSGTIFFESSKNQWSGEFQAVWSANRKMGFAMEHIPEVNKVFRILEEQAEYPTAPPAPQSGSQ